MFNEFRSSDRRPNEEYRGRHRFEHWYRDNTVYFITATCREWFPAFHNETAKSIFWDRFSVYTEKHGFVPWVVSLLDTHYHALGYLPEGNQLGPMMQKIHGSVAKLTNDLLPVRHLPFWREPGGRDYFDGCIRDELQCRRAFRYTLTQPRRHRICEDYTKYPHTHVSIDLERGVRRALHLQAFMVNVPYKRYGE